MADLRDQLQAVFEAEASDHIETLRAILSDARKGQTVDMREAFRRAHSLKGAARAVDAPDVEGAAHELEALLSALQDEAGAPETVRIREAQSLLAAMEELVAARTRGPVQPVVGTAEEAGAETGGSLPEFTRVHSGHIYSLTGSFTEVVAELDALGGLPDRLREMHAQASAIARSLSRIVIETERAGRRSALPAVVRETDALVRSLAAVGRDQRDIAFGLSRSTARLGEDVAQVSMARASEVFAGLDRMVQDAAIDAGLEIDLDFEGLETQASRRLLQSLRDPVLHLLRNTLAHGIEPPGERIRAGKPRRGAVGLALRANGGRLEVSVWDDGRGPDLGRIEETAIRRGLLAPRVRGDGAPEPEQLLSYVFEPGFSTRDAVDRMSGRGMGLSIVAEGARAAGGGAYMRARHGGGTETVLYAPLTVSRQTLLLVEEAGQVYAIPSSAVASLRRVDRQSLEEVNARSVFDMGEDGNRKLVPYVGISGLLGLHVEDEYDADFLAIAVLRQGARRLGVGVSALAGVREAMVTPLPVDPLADGSAARSVVTGVAQLDHGRIALVLSADELFLRHVTSGDAQHRTLRPIRTERPRTTVLVVDDSITTRTLEKSILETNGYRVVLAVDGLQALNLLREGGEQIDIVVTDIEMPRMDGFQLLSALKADTQLAGLPVVVMTSRGDPEDVRRGLELGADAYVTKQSFDQRELLAVIGQLA